mgnify:CR=1 FL=1
MRSVLSFLLLLSVRQLGRLVYHHRADWLGGRPEDWSQIRVIAVLNHTSLYEPILAGYAPIGLLWRLARHGVLPVAEKTMRRRIGFFFSFLVRHVVVVTRKRDQTWDRVMNHVDDRALVVILPEGRMKRRDGLDSSGQPMSIRGGIADILSVLDQGKLLVVYSGGLHHIQAPGELMPRMFRNLHARLEVLDIPTYRNYLLSDSTADSFKAATIRDLTWRRDTFCPEESSFPPLPDDVQLPPLLR